MELINETKTYELTHSSGAVFVVKDWTVGMQEEVDRRCLVPDGKGGFNFLVSLEREIKITLAVSNWRGITMDGVDAPCTLENKKKLPVGVIYWLVKDIDERAGLRMTEDQKKN